MRERARHAAAGTQVPFGDVVRQVRDRVDPEQSGLERYIAGEHMDTDDLRLRRWGDVGDGYLGPAFHMRFKPGHVLYGSRRTYLRKVAIADFEGVTANTTYVLEPKDPNVLLPGLLAFIMQTEAFNQHSVRESKGSVNPYVNFSDLAWYEFTLPPIEVQKSIANALIAVDETLEKYRTLEQHLASTELQLVTRYLGERSVELGSIGNWVGGGTPSKAKKDYWSGDIPWVSPKDLKSRELFDSTDHITDSAVKNSSSRVVPKDSILVAFRTGILRHSFPVVIARREVAINQDLKALIPNDSFVPEFVAAHLLLCETEILRACVKAGTTVESVDFSLFKKLPIHLPGMSVQKEFAQCAALAKHASQSNNERIERLKSIRRSVLSQLGTKDV